ncbi:MAG: Rieske 2Fe-2S domain-containing protein [Ginsengibacter sp.]
MSHEKKYRWIKIATTIDQLIFTENNLTEIDIEGKKICLAKTTAGLKACSSKCPHAGGKLSEGKLDKKENIVCCVHHYSFSLAHGRDTLGEGYFLKIYPVRESEEGIFVGIEEMTNKV